MARKRITQMFPFLLPLRVWQRKLFYDLKMKGDKNIYATIFGGSLEYEVCSLKSLMVNKDSGYDIVYQKNKVDNLKILSKTMNHILIFPGEVFSFCYLARNSKKYGEYKDGLVLVDDKIVPQKGGGICQLSNLLYHLFLLSPLTVIERHSHNVKSFSNPDKDAIDGIDATISHGWLDLKVKNETDKVFQIDINFDDDYIYGKLLVDKELKEVYEIKNEDKKYFKQDGRVFLTTSVVRIVKDKVTNKKLRKEKLYDTNILISYELSDDIVIEKRN